MKNMLTKIALAGLLLSSAITTASAQTQSRTYGDAGYNSTGNSDHDRADEMHAKTSGGTGG